MKQRRERQSVSEMKLQLQLGVFMLLVHVCSASLQHITVKSGHTVHLSCHVPDAHLTQVEWKNPDHNIMFFGRIKGEASSRDKRYTIVKVSESEFTVSISNVTFKDGGSYTCSQYSRRTGQHTTVKVVEVTVIGRPKMSVASDDGKSVLECRAEATHHAPQISWRLNNGPEFKAFNDVHREGKIFVSMDQITIDPRKKIDTVKCLVRHPALHSQPLMTFVKIGQKPPTPPYIPPTARPAESTEKTSMSTPADMTRTPSNPVTEHTVTPTGSLQSTTENSRTSDSSLSTRGNNDTDRNVTGTTENSRTSDSSLSTRGNNDTDRNVTGTTAAGWTSVSMTTEMATSYNQTEGNTTVGSNDNPGLQAGSGRSSSLLVFLVTCLIVCLLVVVIFFTIKLRRAHLAWKRENEDSDPSEESNRSRSSQEERNAQGQRRRGIFNTAFTQYVTDKPSTITSVVNTAAVETVRTKPNMEPTACPVTPGPPTASGGIKETEL